MERALTAAMEAAAAAERERKDAQRGIDSDLWMPMMLLTFDTLAEMKARADHEPDGGAFEERKDLDRRAGHLNMMVLTAEVEGYCVGQRVVCTHTEADYLIENNWARPATPEEIEESRALAAAHDTAPGDPPVVARLRRRVRWLSRVEVK